MGLRLQHHLKDAGLTALVAAGLGIFIVGFRTYDIGKGLTFDYQFVDLGIAIVTIFFGRLGLSLAADGLSWPALALGAVLGAIGASPLKLPSTFLHWFVVLAGLLIVLRTIWPWANHALAVARHSPRGVPVGQAVAKWFGAALLAAAFVLPMTPLADQKTMDLSVLILTYVMLGWGLNIVVGLAGLLDLGYVAFYAVGAYSYALLSTQYGLRLRGDYLAIVTMGFGEIIRLVLLNWVDLSNGPAGIGSIPGPTLFGAVFAETAPAGKQTFAEMMGIPFTGNQRLIFLYYIILALALVTNFFTQRVRRLPVGRAWEALREDETACKALGINPTNTKLTAFAVGAMFAGFAGSFFAAKQRFISPESFSFIESAIILAIVVLGGMGSQIGVVLAAVLLIGLPEWFRDLGAYRMVAFGLAMVLIMVFRPRGLIAHREPSVRLHPVHDPVHRRGVA
jgi:branched-chain amino acid transport system permease protein